MARKAKTAVTPYFKIGDISPRLYSAFLEPIGNMVNGSMYNPKHPTADEQGFRKDWIDELRATDLPAVRLPGGNFMSGWEWKDSIGPKDQRKAHLDLAWHQYYTNEVGHDEYLQWMEKLGKEPMYTINLGTDGLKDALHIVEYTNHPGGTYWSDLRKENGHEKPYGVKMWYLGNEMDGYWQIASWEKDPKHYGVLANETSKVMKWVDGTIQTGVCVSCAPSLSHYPEWDRLVLQECYNSVDFISMHQYQSVKRGDIASFMAASRYFEDYINTEIALCDYMQTMMRSPKKLMLSFDEYGVSMREPAESFQYGRDPWLSYRNHYKFPTTDFIRHDPDNMPTRFRQSDHVMLPVLANAGVLLAFLRHADRVKIGCMTGGLQTIAPVTHDGPTTAAATYSYAQLMRYGKGVSMKTANICDTYDIPSYAVDDTNQYAEQNDITFIDSAAALDEESGELNVFVINRSWEDEMDYELDCSTFEGYKFVEQLEMYTDDPEDASVAPRVNNGAEEVNGVVHTKLGKLSWNVFCFKKI